MARATGGSCTACQLERCTTGPGRPPTFWNGTDACWLTSNQCSRTWTDSGYHPRARSMRRPMATRSCRGRAGASTSTQDDHVVDTVGSCPSSHAIQWRTGCNDHRRLGHSIGWGSRATSLIPVTATPPIEGFTMLHVQWHGGLDDPVRRRIFCIIRQHHYHRLQKSRSGTWLNYNVGCDDRQRGFNGNPTFNLDWDDLWQYGQHQRQYGILCSRHLQPHGVTVCTFSGRYGLGYGACSGSGPSTTADPPEDNLFARSRAIDWLLAHRKPGSIR